MPSDPVPSAAPPGSSDSVTRCCALAAGTPVTLEIVDMVSSSTAKRGDSVRLRLAAPLMLGNRLVLPAGTEGVGEVIHAERARAGGKAGELIVSARYLDGPAGRIRLRALKLGGSGKDRSSAALGTAAAIGVFGMLVRGGELEIPAGAGAQAKLAEALPVPPPGADAPASAEVATAGEAPAAPAHDPATAPSAPGDAAGDTGEMDSQHSGAEMPNDPAASP